MNKIIQEYTFCEYDLKFIFRNKDIEIGAKVAILCDLPIKPQNIGTIKEIRDNGLCLVEKVITGLILTYPKSMIRVIEPIIVSSEELFINNDFYTNDGFIGKVDKRYKKDNDWIISSNNQEYLENNIKKIIGYPEQFSYLCNDGPPHDHNESWKDDLYLEQFLPTMLNEIILDNCKILVLTREVCPNYGGSHINKDCSCKSGFIPAPVLKNNKIIITYKKMFEMDNVTS